MRLAELDYDLPRAQVALRPLAERDASRLLVVAGGIEHRRFRDLPELVPEGAVVVLNDARVRPARLLGRREPGGGRVELLCVRPAGDLWLCLGRASKPLRPDTRVTLPAGSNGAAGHTAPTQATIVARRADELLEVDFGAADVPALLDGAGRTPLPPYLGRPDEPDDRARYQTVFAQTGHAVAAPTAGLHFTPPLLARLAVRAEVRYLTLEVGPGTFLPPRHDEAPWSVPAEAYAIPRGTIEAVERGRRDGRPIIAVGTTTVRALETYARTGAAAGETALTLAPGDPFQVVSALVTNFHLPRSTLLALVCAFAGCDRTLHAYAEAVRAGYRFLSYGDAMLIWPLPAPSAASRSPA